MTGQQQCNWNKSSLLHRLWSCERISCFWKQWENFAVTVTGYQPCKDPLFLLFSFLDGYHPGHFNTQWSTVSCNKAWLATGFMATRGAILKQWSTVSPPNIADEKVDQLGLYRKDKLGATLSHQDLTSCFHHKWDQFIAKVLPASDRTPATTPALCSPNLLHN